MDVQNIAQNLAVIHDRIARAAHSAGRSPDEITLVAVSKRANAERVQEAFEAGVRDFGENYVQEALPKITSAALPKEVRWHFIGHLQSNKAREVAGVFSLIQSVDSLSLAQEIGRRAFLVGRSVDVLLEVKLDTSAAKFGIQPEQALETASVVLTIPGVRLCGLMGMAPFGTDPEAARPTFRTLRTLFNQLPPDARQTLSMGMSSDFEVAIQEGATMVRIGTALFGQRPPD